MNVLKKTTFLLLTCMSISAAAVAEEYSSVSYKAVFNGESFALFDNLQQNYIDNSNLYVKVIKQKNGVNTLIYTGLLGGYENGNWNHLDFSEVDYQLIIDWSGAHDEVLCITRVDGYALQSASVQTNQVTSASLANSESFKVSYDGDYYEAKAVGGKMFNISIADETELTNKKIYVAEYSSDGRMTALSEAVKLECQTDYSAQLQLSENVQCIKVITIDFESQKPMSNYIYLSQGGEDLYGNDFNNAFSADISKAIFGKINSSTDCDFVKIEPTQSGSYVIFANSDDGVEGALYNSGENMISSGRTFGGGYFIKANLSAGETYYIKTCSSAVGDYKLTVTQVQDAEDVFISADAVRITKNPVNSQLDVTLADSNGAVIGTSRFDSGSNTVKIPITNSDNKYYITISDGQRAVSVLEVNVDSLSIDVNCSPKTYISVPISAVETENLNNVYFSLIFDKDKLALFDACEQTYTKAETGVGLVSSAEVDIKCIDDGSVVFKSVKNLTQQWSGIVNTVKLKSKLGGNTNVSILAYTVR